MAFIRSDFDLYGKHGRILRSLVDKNIFTSGADGFVKSALLGIYHGKKAEPEISQENKIEVSRVYFESRQNIVDILFTFLQHEKVYQKKPLTTSEVFSYEENPNDYNQLIQDLKEYALYGLEVFDEKYQNIIDNASTEIVIEEIIDMDLLTTNELKKQVIKDEQELFVKTFEDKDINDELNEIMSTYKEG